MSCYDSYFLSSSCTFDCSHCEKKHRMDGKSENSVSWIEEKQNLQPTLLDTFMQGKSSLLDTLDDIQDDAFAEEPSTSAVIADENKMVIDTTDEVYGGFYQQRDQSVEDFESYEDGIEVISLKTALEKYPWFGKRM